MHIISRSWIYEQPTYGFFRSYTSTLFDHSIMKGIFKEVTKKVSHLMIKGVMKVFLNLLPGNE